MSVKYPINTFFRALATCAPALLFAPPIHAINAPVVCPAPGMVAVPGGYQLTQDMACSNGISWIPNNMFLNLNGFVLTAGGAPVNSGVTIRNGTLYTSGIYWTGGNGTLNNVTVVPQFPISPASHFFIETTNNLTVNKCTFVDIPGVALDFYFGQGGTVRNSLFIGNNIAISLQGAGTAGVVIQNNTFIGNAAGVNLHNEDFGGVNNNTISYNVFQSNDVGLNVNALPEQHPSMRGNRFLNNQFIANRHSGMNIQVACNPNAPTGIPCPGQNSLVSGNQLHFNGYASNIDDGITARATNCPSGQANCLAGWKLSNNKANMNSDLGFDVKGVTDGGGNSAKLNRDPLQCIGVKCGLVPGPGARDVLEPALAPDQFLHQYKHR